MDPILYRAIIECNNDVLSRNRDRLDDQLTPNKNTVLHIAARAGRNVTASKILTMSANPSAMLRAVNSKGETALHVAAREGHSLIIKTLVQRARALDEEEAPENGLRIAQEICTMRNEDGDTALHEAVRTSVFIKHNYEEASSYQDPGAKTVGHSPGELLSMDETLHLEAVSLLIEPRFSYPVNNSGETPLYLAAESGYHQLVGEILRCCNEPAYEGPGGRTALHASAMSNNGKSTQLLLEWKKELARATDTYGWTPLHYAADFGHVNRVKQLLDSDKSLAYMTTAAVVCGKNTALLLAARQGHEEVIMELISQCPDCWEIVNDKGQSVFHFIVNDQELIIELLNIDPSIRSLMNESDVDGNTPLHESVVCSLFLYFPLEHFRLPKMRFNKANMTPVDLLEKVYDDDDGRPPNTKWAIMNHLAEIGVSLGRRNAIIQSQKGKEPFWTWMIPVRKDIKENARRMEETNLLVATLVATVTFAAGIATPGGFHDNGVPNQGMAVLGRDAAFKAFAVTNTAALMLSTCAVLVFLEVGHTKETSFSFYDLASSMILSFITGSYAVLGHVPSLAIPLCAVCSVYLAMMLRLPFFLNLYDYKFGAYLMEPIKDKPLGVVRTDHCSEEP